MSEESGPPPESDSGPGGQADDLRRRGRRGRRGRGGGFPALPQGGPTGFRAPGAPGGFRPPIQGGFRPPRPQGPRSGPPRFGAPFRAQRPAAPVGDDDESSQARELAAYERRQQQQRPGGGFRAGGWRGGPRRQGSYEETIRRVTAGPRTAAPSHEAGEPIAGPHAVLEAIRAGRQIRSLYMSQDRSLRTGAVSELITEAQERRIFIRYVDKMELARLSPVENHQGVVAIVEGRPGVDLDELLVHIDTVETPLVLLLDQIQDPQNFGVLLRSAEGAGVDGVVIPRHRAVGLTAAVARTSAGASEHLLVAEVANLRQAVDALKEKGIWVVATDTSGDLLYDEVDYRGPTAFVVGGEHEGIRRLVLEGCDQVVRIPMNGQVESLNAAAAGTVLLYEAVRQRVRDAAPSPTRTPRPAAPPREVRDRDEGVEDRDEEALDDVEEQIEEEDRELEAIMEEPSALDLTLPMPEPEPDGADKPRKRAAKPTVKKAAKAVKKTAAAKPRAPRAKKTEG